ncbi:hypothetical protein KPH14_012978, partial [Odynerus spinipes]
GSDPETLITLFKSFVRSIIDYGALIYFPTQKFLREKLERIQFIAIRLALGYRKTTPTNILIAESKLPLLKERVTQLCDCFVTKTLSNTNSLTFKAIKSYQNICSRRRITKRTRILCQCLMSARDYHIIEARNNFYIYCNEFCTTITAIPIDISLRSELRSGGIVKALLQNLLGKIKAVTIYTDGSKIPGSSSVGSACICPELNITVIRSINPHASVYTAECCALNDALDVALDHQDHNFFILTDSLSALLALHSPVAAIKTNSFILDVKRKYNQFNRNQHTSSINFIWIPSHVGIQGNEDADAAAKSGTHSRSLDILKVPYTDLRERFKLRAFQQTKEHIKKLGSVKGRKYFLKFFSESPVPWYSHKNLSRESVVSLNRMRADHYNLAASLARVGIITDQKCKCSYDYENLNHVIWQCKLYDSKRPKLLESLRKLGFQLPLDIDIFIATPNIKACTHILSYLKDCNLNI